MHKNSVVRALYPGTFDPITNGHMDIIKRAGRLFDHLTVAVAKTTTKNPLFTLAQRKKLVRESTKDLTHVEVVTLSGLLADQASELEVDVVVRGLRAVSDFEYEMMMALMNRKLNREFETVFLMPSLRWVYLHSSVVREVGILGGDISDLVPPSVTKAFQAARRKKKR